MDRRTIIAAIINATKKPQLAAPTNLSIDDTTLSFSQVENATSYEVFADGASIGIYQIQTYTISPTVTNLTASSSNPTTIFEGGTATLTFTADGVNYKTPTTMPTISGATGTYTRTSDTECSITLSDATANVSFTIAGEVLIKTYTITPTLNNVIADSSNPTTIKQDESVTLTFTAADGYTLPDTVTVTGATATWKTWMVYDIVGTSTNCYFDEEMTETTYSGTCDEDKSITINLYADGTTYAVPTTLTVTGGTYTKISNSHATLVITNPTEDIDFTATGLTTTAAPTNLAVSDTTITFDPVDGATSYEVYATDSEGNETDLGEYTPS